MLIDRSMRLGGWNYKTGMMSMDKVQQQYNQTFELNQIGTIRPNNSKGLAHFAMV